MKKTLLRAALSALLLGTAATALMMTPALAAKEKEPPGPKASNAVGLALQAALAAAQAKDGATAQAKLNEARAAAATDFDKVEVDQVVAYIAINSNPSDHAGALAAYKSAIANPMFSSLPAGDQAATLKNAMILASEAKDFAGAIQIGERASAAGQLTDEGAATLSVAYFYSNQYDKAQMLAQKSVDASVAAGKKPNEGSLQIIMRSYVKKGDQASARKVLEQLALYYPTAQVWGDMVDTAFVGGMKDMQLLQLYRLRVISGAAGDSSDYFAGADLAMKNGYPGETVSMLQAASSRGVALQGGASALLSQARTKAGTDQNTLSANDAAAAKSATGQLDVIVAEQYFGYGRYSESAAAAKRAMSKGGVKDSEEPKMVAGMAAAAQGQYAEAIQTFNTVGGTEGQKKIAHLWTVYAQSKSQPAATAATAPAPAQR